MRMTNRSMALMVAVTLTISTQASVAEAYPTRSEERFQSCSTYAFTDPYSTGLWMTARKNTVSGGLDVWETAKTWNNQKVIDLALEVSGVAEFDVYFDPTLPSTVLGSGDCGSGYLRLNDSMADHAWLDFISTHEGGHVIGLGHSGYYASHDLDNPPAMYTPACSGAGPTVETAYSQEDEAHVINRLGTANPPSLHANQSFERGSTIYWGNNGGTLKYNSTGGVDGPSYVRYRPSSESKYMYQTVDATVVNYLTTGLSIDGRVNHKLHNSAHAGDVKLQILIREIEFDGMCGAFLSGLNEHKRDLVTPTWTVALTTGWQDVGSYWDLDTTTTYPVLNDWEGVEIRVRVLSRVRQDGGAGSLAYVRLDNVRARER